MTGSTMTGSTMSGSTMSGFTMSGFGLRFPSIANAARPPRHEV